MVPGIQDGQTSGALAGAAAPLPPSSANCDSSHLVVEIEKRLDNTGSIMDSTIYYHIPINDLIDFNPKIVPEKSEVFSRIPPY